LSAPQTPSGVSLRDYYAEQSARIEREFRAASHGRRTIEERAALVDRVLEELCREFLAGDPAGVSNLCLVALGGYGRRALFPHSDVDLLFLSESGGVENRHREATRAISRSLWDLHLRLSPFNRTLTECERLHGDNPEFSVALLDSRFLAGDARLFARLHDDLLPRLIARERSGLLRNLSELTRERHEKEGDTIFHLEPNLKNSPGGLRDYNVAYWVAVLTQEQRDAPSGEPDGLWPAKLRKEIGEAFDFLAAARCFLHYRQGRDDNVLTYELQAEAAEQGVGVESGRAVDPAAWMRVYFRHARAIYGLSTQLLDEAMPAASSLRDRIEDWRSRRSRSDFVVTNGRLSLRQPARLEGYEALFRLFDFLARNRVKLSREAETQVGEALRTLGPAGTHVPGLWEPMRRILTAPYAANALRAMHSTGLLVQLFPEFAVIDSLVMRDFYHHYTVDAHSFMAIENIHRLREAKAKWERPFADIFSELEQPELLFLSLLFHDVGKGMGVKNHAQGSLTAVERVFPRLGLRSEDAETVRFLIANHLEMSANLLRRDIFDLQTVRAFAEKVGTPERLKLLCLFTYADIRAVNPEALTPWKAESLWQLYVSTANYMDRSLDEERFHAAARDQQFLDRILPLLRPDARPEALSAFLEGLPRRYVLAHSPEEIATHFEMSREFGENPVQVRVERRDHLYRLTLLATDRPFLFAGISGTLAAWGMNIWKAEAFANAARTVVDSFEFTDPHSTLALNPPEAERLRGNLVAVLSGTASLEKLMRGRTGPLAARPPKVRIPTQIRFDDASSSHSSLMEIVTQDAPGLLYRVSAALANCGCNIEVALIDTEGLRAVDTFYLTVNGAKLSAAQKDTLRETLLQES
jgi:[protein-PII] uridylyltransferase